MDLSVLIPARNEMFLGHTVEDILKNMRGRTEIIVVLDGQWPVAPIPDHPAVTLIYHSESIGQRAATNEAARLSKAKYIMKCDAHCSFDEGFDVKLMADCKPDWTMIPRMYNLHVFDWRCKKCGDRSYMGPKPQRCVKCDNTEDFEQVLVWKRRENRYSDFWRFDNNLKFQYWRAYGKRPENKGKYIADTMSSIGACFFMQRDRYWEIGGLDEKHGSWGQVGTEIACKSWLSGGRHVVNRKTWFAHMFRTRKGFSFPYPLSGKQVARARQYSKKLWIGNNWPKAKHDLQWLINKFSPVPDWGNGLKKGLVYYTSNRCEERILIACRQQIDRCMNIYGYPIVSVSQLSIGWHKNIVMNLQPSALSLFKQVLKGLGEIDAEIVFLLEHDLLYHPKHFDFTPQKENIFYYDRNKWNLDPETGKAVFYHTNVPSMLCAYRELLLEHYRKKVEITERDGFKSSLGYSPPRGLPKEDRLGKHKSWLAELPTIDIRHDMTYTRKRMSKDQFRSERSCRGWQEADEIPGWGKTIGRFDDFLMEIQRIF